MASTRADNSSARTGNRSPSRTNHPRGQGERLRDELLDAAQAIVVESGSAAGLSLRALASRVGVAATSVYLHFPDLQAVRIALAHRAFAAFSAQRNAAVSGIDDAALALVTGCQAYVDWAMMHAGEYRLMFSADMSLLIADVTGPSRTAFDGLVAAVALCQDSGAADLTGDPQWTAIMLWTALHGQVTLRIDRPQFPWPPAAEMVADQVARLVRLTMPAG